MSCWIYRKLVWKSVRIFTQSKPVFLNQFLANFWTDCQYISRVLLQENETLGRLSEDGIALNHLEHFRPASRFVRRLFKQLHNCNLEGLVGVLEQLRPDQEPMIFRQIHLRNGSFEVNFDKSLFSEIRVNDADLVGGKHNHRFIVNPLDFIDLLLFNENILKSLINHSYINNRV